MNIKLDENLPSRLVPALAKLGHDVGSVASERPTGDRVEEGRVAYRVRRRVAAR